MGIRKAVVPAAGLGTRFLPATKAIPKEMIPVVDRPAIQYVVEEAARAGLTDVLMVTGRNKSALQDHFDRAYELEETLRGNPGKADLLAAVQEASAIATMHYVRQQDPRGLGHAVRCAAEHVGAEPFAVLLGDDLIDARDPVLPRMVEVQQRTGGCVLCLMEVPPAEIGRYGVAAVRPTDEPDLYDVHGMVEKPEPGDAPSNLALIGRYVLAPEIFGFIDRTPPGRGGEIQLTDAVAAFREAGGPVHGVVFRGRRYDTGEVGGYLRAIVEMAAQREDLGPAFVSWLREWLAAGAAS